MPRAPIAPTEILALRLPANLPPLSRVFVSLGLALARWEERRRSRSALLRLDRHLLSDIGLTAAGRAEECGKPFWRD